MFISEIVSALRPIRGSHRASTVFTLAAVLMLLTAPVPQLFAQGAVLEEVTVTARRYKESLQDTPVSVNAMSDEYLEAQGIGKVHDIIQFSPGTTYIRFNKVQDEYSMRGNSSQTEGTSGDSSVQSVIDNVVISKDFMKNPAFFDVERVEILRGPQGTSFGRNASAGLVHIITKRPTQEFEAGLTLGAGDFQAYNVDAYVSGGLMNNLAGRLAVHFDTNDGTTESRSTGNGLDGQQNTSVRGSLLFNPVSNLQVYFKAEFNRDDDDAPVRRSQDCTKPQVVFAPPGPPNFHPTFAGGGVVPETSFPDFTDPCDVHKTEISSGQDFFLTRNILNLTSEVVWNVTDSISATWITGYLDGDSSYLLDAQGTPSNVLFQRTINDAHSFTQEVRVDNHAGGGYRLNWLGGIGVKWLLGFYYLNDDHDRNDENRFYVQPGGPNGRNAGNPLTLDTKISSGDTESFGGFGELSLDFTDKISGTVGLRWSGDEKDYQLAHTAIGWAPKVTGFVFVPNAGAICDFPSGPPAPSSGSGGCPFSGFATPVKTNANWDNISVKGSLQYAVTDDVMLYALYSEGYKTGGFQPEAASAADALIPFNEETSTNYEFGMKSEFFDRLRLNITGFFTDYDDIQITQFLSVPGGFRAFIANAGGVEVHGVEAEAVWQVTDVLRLSGSYANLHSRFVNTLLTTDDTGTLTDFSGTRPDNAVDWTGTLVGELNFPLSDGSTLTFRGDWRGRSASFDDVGELPDRKRPAASVFGARVTWRSSNEKWSAALWGKNLNQEEQILNIGPPQPDTLQHPVAFAPPRTFGGTVSYTF
ncbi:MAG: TonB-dependent receptor [Gammaproteobacteria bacterium]